MSSDKEIEIFTTGVKLLNETLVNISNFDKASLFFEMAAAQAETFMKIHKEDNENYIQYHYMPEGLEHRLGGPSYINYNKSANPDCRIKQYCIFGKCHRKDGPAIVFADHRRQYLQMGIRHRINGPAYIGKYGDQFWIAGKQLSLEEHLAAGGTIGEKDVGSS